MPSIGILIGNCPPSLVRRTMDTLADIYAPDEMTSQDLKILEHDENHIELCVAPKGLRGISVVFPTEDIDNRHVDTAIFLAAPASVMDYDLFCNLMMKLVSELPPDEEILMDFGLSGKLVPLDKWQDEDIKLFSHEWISMCLAGDYQTQMYMLARGMVPVNLACVNFPVSLTPVLYKNYGLYPLPRKLKVSNFKNYYMMMDYLASLQWDFAEEPCTERAAVRVRHIKDDNINLDKNSLSPDELGKIIAEEMNRDDSQTFSVSMIPFSPSGRTSMTDDMGNESSDFEPVQHIIGSDFVSVFDLDEREQLCCVPMSCITHLMADIPGFSIDGRQFIAEHILDDSDIAGILSAAPVYTPPQPFMKPAYPGGEGEATQRTFILMWNPTISSYKIDQFRSDLRAMLLPGFNWSVREHEKARMGDRFYMVSCSPRFPRGIVMCGIFTSNPYRGNDWNTQRNSSDIWYMDLKPVFMMDPRHPDLMPVSLLETAIPDFNWQGGASGRMLSAEEAEILEEIWAPYAQHYRTTLDEALTGPYFPDLKFNTIVDTDPTF